MSDEPSQVVLSLGSNLGNSAEILTAALGELAKLAGLQPIAVSSLYATTPISEIVQPDFLNLVMLAKAKLSAEELLTKCLAIESDFGRYRDPDLPHGPRTLDIDLIQYGELTSETDFLQLPHPRAKERAFVLVPWAEIDPDAELAGVKISHLISGLSLNGVSKIANSQEKMRKAIYL